MEDDKAVTGQSARIIRDPEEVFCEGLRVLLHDLDLLTSATQYPLQSSDIRHNAAGLAGEPAQERRLGADNT